MGPEFPGVAVAPGEPHPVPGGVQPDLDPAAQVPGWPVARAGIEKVVRVPKADSMTTTIAEAITASGLYCIITVYCSVLYK